MKTSKSIFDEAQEGTSVRNIIKFAQQVYLFERNCIFHIIIWKRNSRNLTGNLQMEARNKDTAIKPTLTLLPQYQFFFGDKFL